MPRTNFVSETHNPEHFRDSSWSFFQRIVKWCEQEYVPGREALQRELIPSLFSAAVPSDIQDLLALPVKFPHT